ncbi:MAG: adenylate/guanylate cyclase domain-containing protein [Rhizobiaceae bacterium]
MSKQVGFLTDPRLTSMRLYSGLVLFFYVTQHLINHAVGLISLEVMQAVNEPIKMFWRFLPITILLYGALAAHFASAFAKLLIRRTLRMPASEKIQIALGLAIPFLLVVHVLGTRFANAQYGVNDSYLYVLLSTFVFSPISGVLNALGLLAAWVHGCIGIYKWLSLKRWYGSVIHQWLLAAATLLPTLALTSFLFNGRAVGPLSTDGEFMENYYANLGVSDLATFGQLSSDIEIARWLLIAVVIVGIVGRLLWHLRERRAATVTVLYQNGPSVSQIPGPTLLEMSKMAGVPHASVCGGKGRCSTCRVKVINGAKFLESPKEAEQRVLARFGATPDIRLACQVRPKNDMTVLRLLPPDATLASVAAFSPWSSGQERIVSVMFADLRDFTETTEHRLPFDVVYLVNQFSRAMGTTIEKHRGRIDKFLGDGFMALFGLDTTPEEGARDAIEAAATMQAELDELNSRLHGELDKPLRMGVGIHTGSVVLGDMGHGAARGLTAIGDTVNTASRLEAATKDHSCAICVSSATLSHAGLNAPEHSLKTVSVRGKTDTIDVIAVQNTEEVLRVGEPQPI